jgi:hypothetical protein
MTGPSSLAGLGIVVVALALPPLAPPESLGKKMNEKERNNNHEENYYDDHHDLAGYINGWGITQKITIISCSVTHCLFVALQQCVGR